MPISEQAALRHVFFDLDNTLTPSRAPMLPAHAPLFGQLCRERDVIIVTGGAEEQIARQIPLSSAGNYYMLSQQGNHAIARDGSVLWREDVSREQEEAARAFANILTADLALAVRDPNDLFENRGSQLAYSTLGFHEDNDKKYAYDPGQSKRRALLGRHADELARLHAIGIEAVPAGSTTIDFFLIGKHKGYNIARLLEHEKWEPAACVYVGDALFPGGNDETVAGVIPTQAVRDPNETFLFIEKLLS